MPPPSETEVVVVGAGLAGLAAARHLAAAGLAVTVLERDEAVGGRVRTDRVDGLLLDRGFQVHNTAYPEAARVLDAAALDLRAFTPGALVRLPGGLHRVGDPRRRPGDLGASLRAPVGTLRDKAVLGALSAVAAAAPVERLLAPAPRSTYAALRRAGLSGTVVERFLRPFLSGVLLEDDLTTSSRFAVLVWRSFVRGTSAVPAGGMQRIPEQLAAGLDVHLGTPVRAVTEDGVETENGARVRAAAVVVATAAPAAAALLPGLPVPAMHGVTTHYHLADEPPVADPVLALDGEGRGPVVNSVVLTNAAPGYAPGRVLVSSSVLGTGPVPEREVRLALRRLWGVETARWEHVAAYRVPDALPAQPPHAPLQEPVRLSPGRYVAGDHRDTSSIQGALVSGRRAAQAVLHDLRGTPEPVTGPWDET